MVGVIASVVGTAFAIAGMDIWGYYAAAALSAPFTTWVVRSRQAPSPVSNLTIEELQKGRVAAGRTSRDDVASPLVNEFELVHTHVAAVLGYDSADLIDPSRQFGELGIDSLAAVELLDRLNLATGQRIPVTVMFDNPTVAGVARYLREHVGDVGGSRPNGEPPMAGARPAAAREDAAETDVGSAYRAAFEALSAVSLDKASALAEEWASWAASCDYTNDAAEAHWCWIRSVVDQSRRRILFGDAQVELIKLQGLAAQASFWLLAADRSRDAAVALDLSRAVWLTARIHRSRSSTGLEQRLRDAGRADLAARWRDVGERLKRSDRAMFDRNATHPPVSMIDSRTLVGSETSQPTVFTADRVALVDHEQLVHDVSHLPGFEDVDASPSFDDLRDAAVDGPIVYLVAHSRDGVALVVSATCEAPDVIELPGLGAAVVNARARAITDALASPSPDEELGATLAWLHETVMRPLSVSIRGPALVTLVPLGALSMLPLHAAGAVRDHEGIWRDRSGGLVLRYAPNARVLRRAQATARRPSDRSLPILTVSAASPTHALPWATAESREVAVLFGENALVRHDDAASVAAVLDSLDDTDVWHFASHYLPDLDDPLQSSLVLADGPLTLDSLYSRSEGSHRLAVLSACSAAVPDGSLLNEVVSFPSALMQAGVAGVVASYARVEDRASMLLVLRFFEGIRKGVEPAYALADAQDWLRSATNLDIQAAFPTSYHPPDTLVDLDAWELRREFAAPAAWAGFSYTGA